MTTKYNSYVLYRQHCSSKSIACDSFNFITSKMYLKIYILFFVTDHSNSKLYCYLFVPINKPPKKHWKLSLKYFFFNKTKTHVDYNCALSTHYLTKVMISKFEEKYLFFNIFSFKRVCKLNEPWILNPKKSLINSIFFQFSVLISGLPKQTRLIFILP